MTEAYSILALVMPSYFFFLLPLSHYIMEVCEVFSIFIFFAWVEKFFYYSNKNKH